METIKHYAPKYFMNPVHKIKVLIVGAGGTGSQVLTSLARINSTLIALQHPGLHIILMDDDRVSQSNIGRQLFSPADTGRYKCEVLIERTNRFFGLNWEAIPQRFTAGVNCNILMTCVDNMDTRIQILELFNRYCKNTNHKNENNKLYYWMDFGNANKIGQVVLGSYPIDQQGLKDTNGLLPTIFDLFPSFKDQKTTDNEPSCSMAEAISKQDLFVNSILAQFGCDILWKLLKDKVIDVHGIFMNLETMNVKPIQIQNGTTNKRSKRENKTISSTGS